MIGLPRRSSGSKWRYGAEVLEEKKITLIEKEPAQAEVLKYNLEAEGYQVQIFRSTEGLLENEVDFGDMVILELLLEPISGIEIIQELRKRSNYFPIVLLTAKSEEGDRVAGLEAGANDYIVKPYSVVELIARVAAIFRTFENIQKGYDANKGLTVVERLFVLSHRVETIRDSISALRLNDTHEEIDSLDTISQELKATANEIAPSGGDELDVREPAASALKVLSGLFDKLGSSRGAEVIVAGAVAGVVAVGGWPAVTAYSLTMAAWMGKDTFEKAIEKALKAEKE